jgi:hypothetical protein
MMVLVLMQSLRVLRDQPQIRIHSVVFVFLMTINS